MRPQVVKELQDRECSSNPSKRENILESLLLNPHYLCSIGRV